MLEAPSAELRARLRDAYAAQDWNRLLAVAEDAAGLPCGRGWLDIQFYAVKALEAKGHWFAFVSGAIKTNLLALLTDLPNLPECFLTDGMPTASPEVKAWITADILPKPPEPVYITEPVTALDVEPEVEAPPEPEPVEVAPPPPTQTAPSIPIEIKVDAVPPSMDDDLAAQEEVLRRAIEASRDGRDHEAIEILSKELASERSERGRFKRKVQIAHLFLSKGRHTVAYPLLEQLASEIDRRKLEEWEPGEVLAYPLSLLLQCLRARRADDAALDRLYSRICCLDPVRALTVME
jgi:type VI secretion system protein ImpA